MRDNATFDGAAGWRAASLYLYVITGFFKMLRADWARELTVFLASMILFATFGYVFDDFLNSEIAAISTGMRAAFGHAFAALIAIVGVALCSYWGKRFLRAETGLLPTARLIGETPRVTKIAAGLVSFTLAAVGQALIWSIVLSRIDPDVPLVCAPIALLATLAGMYGRWRRPFSPAAKAAYPVRWQGAGLSVAQSLARWRLDQWLFRHRASQAATAAAVLPALLTPAAIIGHQPPIVTTALAFAAGELIAVGFAFQLAEDLRYAAAERHAGISHEEYVKSWELLALKVAAAALLILGSLCALALVWTGAALAPALDLTLKIVLIGIIPIACFPWLMLQIDGRRPAIVIFPQFIVTLFVATALLASWVALLLLPLLRYYGDNTQAGRYYRAS